MITIAGGILLAFGAIVAGLAVLVGLAAGVNEIIAEAEENRRRKPLPKPEPKPDFVEVWTTANPGKTAALVTGASVWGVLLMALPYVTISLTVAGACFYGLRYNKQRGA